MDIFARLIEPSRHVNCHFFRISRSCKGFRSILNEITRKPTKLKYSTSGLNTTTFEKSRNFHAEAAVSTSDELGNQESQSLKETFTYTDSSKIEDPKAQALYLTKSVLKTGLPAIHDRHLGFNVDGIISKFEENLKDSMLFCYGEEELYRKKNSVINTMINLMQTTWRETSKSYSSNFEKSLFYKQHILTTIKRGNNLNIQIAGKPIRSFLMMSKNPLQPFATVEEVAASVDDEVVWNEVYNPAFNFRVSKQQSKVMSPFLANAPFPHLHTLFITPSRRHADMNRLIGQGLLFTFAHAVAYALSMPENVIGMKEIQPVSMQCVINDGRRFTFIGHQLNTLDFISDAGIKNFFWIDDNVEMFKYAYLKIPGDKRYKGITETEIYLEDTNRESFEKFLKFVLL